MSSPKFNTKKRPSEMESLKAILSYRSEPKEFILPYAKAPSGLRVKKILVK
jgi:hypothetical protein|tara:strand:- start:1149 stop:1301 length:153 start_codon:yes stop_codon:yes gene_type:complete